MSRAISRGTVGGRRGSENRTRYLHKRRITLRGYVLERIAELLLLESEGRAVVELNRDLGERKRFLIGHPLRQGDGALRRGVRDLSWNTEKELVLLVNRSVDRLAFSSVCL